MKTFKQQLRFAERTLRKMKKNYPYQIKIGGMTAEMAADELQCMEAIIQTLTDLDRGVNPSGDDQFAPLFL